MKIIVFFSVSLYFFFRIVDQLMYTISSDEQLNKTILLAHSHEWNVPSGQIEFVRSKCPVDRCILTMNANESGTADAILFNNVHKMTISIATRPPNQVKYSSLLNSRYVPCPPWHNIIYIRLFHFRYGFCTI